MNSLFGKLFGPTQIESHKAELRTSTQGKEIRHPLFASPRIRGSVDGICRDEIRGWIIDEAEPNRYIKLCLMADGQFVEKTSACIFRKDLEQLFRSKGLHGFAFRIPDCLQGKPELTIEVRLEDSRQLCAPSIFRNPSPQKAVCHAQRKPCLLLMHIPKAGVTAVRSALRSDALTDRQLWIYPDPPGLPVEHLLFLTGTQLKRVECIVGHFDFGLHAFLPQTAQYATILRDPVERCISHYFHERVKSADPNNPARNLALDEFVELGPVSAYDNVMVRMISGRGAVAAGSVTRDHLEEAINNIRQSFCYVGLQEHTRDAVAALAQHLSLQPNLLGRENIGEYQRETCAAPRTVRKLRELNSFDQELFEYVRANFWSSGDEGRVSGSQVGEASLADQPAYRT